MFTGLKLVMAVLVALATYVFGADVSKAHSFNVALVVPLSGENTDEGKQIHDGFMLATTEQDGHADQESDGHLGGLDVYVTVIDSRDPGELVRLLAAREIDIVVKPENGLPTYAVAKWVGETGVTVLQPGKNPFANTSQPGVSAFKNAFSQAYGSPPSQYSANGYNAARRIAVAVRAQEGVEDRQALEGSFAGTASGYSW